MRAPFQKASMPRIRALGGAGRPGAGSVKAARAASSRPAGSRAASRTTAAGHVFRDFVATLERLERGRRRKAVLTRNADASVAARSRSGKGGTA
ncbi:hypothetical protein ACT6QH_08990 [Xanthobacter sp. TB0139]|uniref:hypothetical protein n=1 Tax=Xanthobacter sp. TB0139 TaxID=3459178 RepID=UPI0040393220